LTDAQRTSPHKGDERVTRTLVAYYSLTGYTRSLAELIVGRRAGESELLEIVPVRTYSYFSAGVKGVRQAMTGVIVELAGAAPPAGSFDALVVLSPTWGWMSSPPVRSFVAQLPPGDGLPAVVGVTHAGGPIGSADRLEQLVSERGYRVLLKLSVFCYDGEAMAAAAARAAAAIAAALADGAASGA